MLGTNEIVRLSTAIQLDQNQMDCQIFNEGYSISLQLQISNQINQLFDRSSGATRCLTVIEEKARWNRQTDAQTHTCSLICQELMAT